MTHRNNYQLIEAKLNITKPKPGFGGFFTT